MARGMDLHRTTCCAWEIKVRAGLQMADRFWVQAGYAELRKVREETLAEGDVLTMPTGAIHSVLNETANTTLSFHVYGRHLNHTGRSQFDPEKKVEKPFIIETQQSG